MFTWYVGTMGFGYKDWEGAFYPQGTSSQDYMKLFARRFNAVELDTTFYGVPRANSLQRWITDTPDDFKFCAKLPKHITHDLGLVGAEADLEQFCSAMRLLGNRLGLLLIQLPPSFTRENQSQLTAFLKILPQDLHFAIEFRHTSWHSAETEDLLNSHGVTWAATQYPGLPASITPTTDRLYIRWIGQHGSYDRHSHERQDKSPELKSWLVQILKLEDTIQEVYGFFNNDYAGFAAGTALRFKKLAGLSVSEPHYPRQERLF